MGGFRRWSSVEAFELDSWRRGDFQDRTPLLGKAKKPRIVRSKSYAPTIAEEGDITTPDFNSHDNHFRGLSLADTSNPSTTEVSTTPLCLQKTLPEVPHHVFDRRQKRWMVYIVSFAGLFSPLSSNIYFPALGNIARVSESILPPSGCNNSFSGSQSIIDESLDIPRYRRPSRSHHHNLYDVPRARALFLGLMG